MDWNQAEIDIVLAWLPRLDMLLRVMCFLMCVNLGMSYFRQLFGKGFRWDSK